jgi:hypothetical protein
MISIVVNAGPEMGTNEMHKDLAKLNQREIVDPSNILTIHR